MTLSLEGLRAFQDDANVRAMLAVIAAKESGGRWNVINGGATFADYSRHPYHGIPTTHGGRAAGCYQFLGTTWARLCDRYDFPDFSPDSQTLGAIALIQGRGALDDVVHGRFEAAVAKLRPEWTSLPGASESRSDWTMDKARALFVSEGGKLATDDLIQPAAPIEDRPQPSKPPEESRMPIPAIILGLIQAAASVLPVIAQIKSDKTQSSAVQNTAIASKVLDVVATTVGAVNQQQAVEIVQQDPAARQKADEALRAQFFDLLKFAQEQEAISWDRTEKSVSEARSFAERMTSGEGWRAIGYGALLGLLALLIIGGGGVMFAYVLFAPKDLFDGSVRAGIIEIVKAIVILVVGFFFGSSSSSRQSGEALRNIAQGKGTQV